MPLTDRDPNVSGRTSRASDMSSASRGLQKGGPARSDLLPSAPGVMSMLRTSTEMGNIGSLTFDSPHLPNMPRAPHWRSGATSRLSTGSARSQHSKRAVHHHHWPSASSGPRRSFTRDFDVPQYVADTLSPTIMNIPGSSPLIPHSRLPRGGGRSFSMTNTSQPTLDLASNRSFASLRNHDMISRPPSPFRYPARLRRPGYRPTSPAMSDITGIHPRRGSRQTNRSRLRAPSITSDIHDEQIRVSRHRGRNRSPTLFSPHSDPPLHHRVFVEQARSVHTPAKASMSSGSTNVRTDSEAPSSDAPSSLPQTPKDDTSMEVLISPTSTQITVRGTVGMMKAEVASHPMYYDYSEQFEPEVMADSEPVAVPLGFVGHVKTIVKERSAAEQTSNHVDFKIIQQIAELPAAELRAELSASPVPRRITRQMILEALEPESTTVEDTTQMIVEKEADVVSMAEKEREDGRSSTTPKKMATAVYKRMDSSIFEKRRSLMSLATSCKSAISNLETSITDSAVRSPLPAKGETEDSASAVVEGSQHGDSNRDIESHPDNSIDVIFEKKISHTPRSSGEKSFKSCEEPIEHQGAYDNRSFEICEDGVTTDRVISAPIPMGFPVVEPQLEVPSKRSASASPSTSYSTPESMLGMLRRPSIPPCKSSSSLPAHRLRAGSKGSRSRPHSAVASVSSSAESISRPPLVPPRESSSSKEAQRTQAVADFLMRLSRPIDFVKSYSALKNDSMERSRDHLIVNRSGSDMKLSEDIPTQVGSIDEDSCNSGQSMNAQSYPEKMMLADQAILPEDTIAHCSVGQHAESGECVPRAASELPTASSRQQHPSMSVPAVQELSSAFSPAETSLLSSSAPVVLALTDFPGPKETNRRDSQTTTHLVWDARKTLKALPDSGSELRVNRRLSQDETTTDLRLSAYRYPLGYLPDLKEESHEDSSVNTSASNLKSNSFRYPFGTPSIRASVDDARLFRTLSVRSFRRSSLAQTRKLPSLNFSRMDLIAKLSEAFDVRSSRSLDGAPEAIHNLVASIPDRPASAGEIREKYKSFFASLDELEGSMESSQPTSISDLMPVKRPFTADEIMAEIDNLTIPSIGALTQRLSEFLPSFKRFYEEGEEPEMDAEDTIMEHAMEQIHEVGVGVGPGVEGPVVKRSSARLRPMPGQPSLVVIEDGLYEELTGKEKGVSDARFGGVGGHTGRSRDGGGHIIDGFTRETTPLAELEAPTPIVLRTRSLSVGCRDLQRASNESRLSRRSLRSLVSTPTETRPWNLDKNYPWATTSSEIDINLPASMLSRDSQRPGPSRLRLHLSGSSITDSSLDDNLFASTASTMLDYHDTGPRERRTVHASRLSVRPQRDNAPSAGYEPGFDMDGLANSPDSIKGHDDSVSPGDRYREYGPGPSIAPYGAEADTGSHFSADFDDVPPRGPRLFHRRLTRNHTKQSNLNYSLQSTDQQGEANFSTAQHTMTRSEAGTYADVRGMSLIRFKIEVARQSASYWFSDTWTKLKRKFRRGHRDSLPTRDEDDVVAYRNKPLPPPPH